MKTDKDIEQLLIQAKKPSLSTDEKAYIKMLLLEHANISLKQQKPSTIYHWSHWFIRTSLSLASVLLVFVGTAYASKNSLPGEPLYIIKVHVVEEITAISKIDSLERTDYDLSLMETRLEELKTINKQTEVLESEDLALIADQIDEHVNDVTTTLNFTKNEVIPHQKKIEVLSKLSSLSEAQTKVSEQNKSLLSLTDSVNHTNENTREVLSETVKDFTESQPTETVNQYLSEQINTVSKQLTSDIVNREIRDNTEQYINNVNEALVDGDTSEALLSVLEAQQEMESEKYLQDTKPENEDEKPEKDLPTQNQENVEIE